MINNSNYYDFFLTDNKSGWKTCENKLKNKFSVLYDMINDYSNKHNFNTYTFKEKIWYFINNETSHPKCLQCDKQLKFGKSLSNGYGKYCSLKCTNKNNEHKENVKKTNNVKYGGSTPFSSDDIKLKTIKTNIERYGVDNVMKLDRVKQIFKEGSIKKYGTEYPAQSKKVKIRIENKDKFSNINIINNDCGNYEIKCGTCENISEFNNNEINYRLRNKIPICKTCVSLKSNLSYPETELFNFLETLNVTPTNNNRTILNGKELDIYIPSHNLAIEYNGLYWHSELYKDNDYHLKKTELCESLGIKLIHVFEDEWLNKQDIVKSRLMNILGLTPNKIYGRNCVIKEVSPKDSKVFLDNNHIQGNVNAKIKIGLYHNDELVSLMTFGLLRKSMGATNIDGTYELFRFCNKLNTTIIGGADKLLKYFIKTHNPKEIISYADRRWSQGDLYEKLGFDFIHNSKPNYWYILGTNREYRFKFRKDVLVKEGFDIHKSEREIMLERGIYRVYDCGNKVYTKKIKI